MESIQAGLPNSYELRERIPHFGALAAATPPRGIGMREFQARLGFVDGWHMLNQARSALVESDACRVFYAEFQLNPTEALHRPRFYLDDAALRLYSSCERPCRSVLRYWNLPTPTRPTDSGSRPSPLIGVVIDAVQSAGLRVVSKDVGNILRRFRSNREWRALALYQHKWVHDEVPAVEGLKGKVTFERFDDICFGR
jgi:hypothetical protein